MGANQGSVTNSYATGTVSGAGSSEFGGLVGYNSGTIGNSYWNTDNDAAAMPGIAAHTQGGRAYGGTMQSAANLSAEHRDTGGSGDVWRNTKGIPIRCS